MSIPTTPAGPSLQHHETFVIVAETLAGWRNPATPEGTDLLAQHYAWAHAQHASGVLLFAGPIDVWSCETVGSGSGEKVRITLSDTGPGLTPQAQRSAMDLFYSGREHGRGLGISLAIVHRIVEMHRGTFTVHSENGAGCRTEIELPQIRGPIESRPELSL